MSVHMNSNIPYKEQMKVPTDEEQDLKGKLEAHASSIMSRYSTKIPQKVQKKINAAQNKVKKRQAILKPRILIIDGTNCYLRAFSIHEYNKDKPPTETSAEPKKFVYGANKDRQITDREGNETGAVFTMIMMLNKMCRDLKATHAFVCWQGYHSREHRSQINAEYKANRTYKKSSSFVPQLKRVQQYIGMLPMVQMKVDYAEADDVIAMLVKEYPDEEKIVCSMDQDFLQLVDDKKKTKFYSPKTKIMFDEAKVIEKYGCRPRNFIYRKIILGDGSDNIKGIKGVGQKTIEKQIGDILINGTITSLDDLIQKCQSKKLKPQLISHKTLLEQNAKIMCLHTNTNLLSLRSINDFKQQINKPVALDNANLRIFMSHDGIYGQMIQGVIKQMYILSYLRKKWELKRNNINQEKQNEPIENIEARLQRRGCSDNQSDRCEQ